MKPAHNRLRHAFSLLELLVTVSLLATIVTSAVLVLRSSQTAWSGHAADQAKLDAAYATLRHITRSVRQADGVTALSAAEDPSGSLSVLASTGQTLVWEHVGTNVLYGVGAPTSLLASGVTALSFVGYRADGETLTTVPAEVQSIVCTVTVELDRAGTPTRTISTRIWMRTW